MEEVRLTFTDFKEAVLQGVSDVAEEGYTVMSEQMQKNNGISREGMVIRKEGCGVSPVFYFDQLYKKYLNGMPLDVMSNVIWSFYKLCKEGSPFPVEEFLDWSKIKDQLFLRVVSTEMNREILGDSVHREVLDLSSIVYARIGSLSDTETGYIRIKRQHLELWGQSEQEVYDTALQNTRKDTVCYRSVAEDLKLEEEEGEMCMGRALIQMDNPMYILSNQIRQFGAVYMLFPEIMDRIVEERDSDVFVLPSSVHETILINATDSVSPAFLQFMVQDVNESVVPKDEQLSNHVYIYSREKGLSIAA